MAVDRTSKLVFADFYRKSGKLAAQAFLKVLVWTVPHRTHSIAWRSTACMPRQSWAQLTGSGVQFSNLAGTGEQIMVHPFTKAVLGQWHQAPADHASRYATIRELRRHITDWLAPCN